MIDRRALLAGIGLGAVAATSAGHGQAKPAPPLSDTWHEAETLPLWPGALPGGDAFRAGALPATISPAVHRTVARPELKLFRPARPNGGALLVMPGGGYAALSIQSEGADIAARMTAAGYTVFVLLYRLPGDGWGDRADIPLIDAQRAMRVIRSRASHDGIDTARIAAIGFSAGGHLCASLATGFAESLHSAIDAIDRLEARPAAAALGYPVITLAAPYTNAGTARQLLGPNPGTDLVERRSPDRHVTDTTPPLFLFHAVDDPVVPMQNSVLMLEAMTAAKRPVEAHFFADGGHGFGLGTPGSRHAQWPELFTDWLNHVLKR